MELLRVPNVARDIFKLNPSARLIPEFHAMGAKRLFAMLLCLDHYSLWSYANKELEPREKLKKALERAGFETKHTSFVRKANYARRIIEGEDEVWNEGLVKYRELQGASALESLEAYEKTVQKALAEPVDFRDEEDKLLIQEQRQFVHQGILVKIQQQKNDIQNLAAQVGGAKVEQGDLEGSESEESDIDEGVGFSPDYV